MKVPVSNEGARYNFIIFFYARLLDKFLENIFSQVDGMEKSPLLEELNPVLNLVRGNQPQFFCYLANTESARLVSGPEP